MIPWPFVIILFIGMSIHITLGLYSRRFKSQSVQLPFEILMYICAIWCATFIFDISSDNLDFKVLMMQVRFLFLPFIVLTLMLIALFFSGYRSWLTKPRLSLLLIIPLVTVVLALTTRYSSVFRYNYHIIQTPAGFSVLGFTSGPWSSFIYNPYTYVLEFVTLLLLLRVIVGSQKIYARQAILFFIAILIPVVVDILFTLGFSPVQGYNMTPSTFAFTGILLAIALFEYRFIEIMPIARTMLFEQLTDPMLVIGPGNRLVDLNPAAEQVLGLSRLENTGRNVRDALSGYPELLDCIGSPQTPCSLITVGKSPRSHQFDIMVQEMASGEENYPAKLVLFRDVTGQKIAEERAVHLASFPELSPVLILEVDYNGAIIYANPYCMQSLEIMGEPDPRVLIPPDIRERLNGTGITESLHELREIKVHGRLFRENVYFTPEFSSLRIYGTDITDRKVTEQALQESERKYRNLYRYAQVGLFETSFKDGTVVACNERYATMAGFSSVEDAIGKDIVHLYVNADDRKEIARILREQGYIEEHTIQLRNHRTGKVFWGQFSARYDYEREAAEGSIIDITGQIEAMIALRESENRSKMLLEAIPDMMFIISSDGVYLDFSVPDTRVLAVPVDQIIGTNIRDSGFKKESTDAIMNNIRLTLDTKKLRQFEYELIVPDGKHQYEARMVPLTEDTVLGIVRDITERRRAEVALKESEQELKALFKGMINAFVLFESVFDDDGVFVSYRFVYINDAYERITGVKNDEVRGKTVHEVWPGTEASWVRAYGEVAVTGVPSSFEMYHEPTGKWYFCNVYRPGESKDRFCVIFDDISERKRTEKELAAAHMRYRELFESISIGILRSTPGPGGALIEANPAALRIFEADSREQFFAMHPPDLYDDPEQRLMISNEIMSKGVIEGREVRFRTLRGKPIWASITAVKKISDDGRTYFDTAIEDITDRRKAEDALRESEEKYREFFTTSRDCVFITTPDGKWIDFNDVAMEMFGYRNREEFAQLPVQDLYARPDERIVFLELIGKEGYVREYPIQLKRKDGTVLDSLITTVPLRKPDGSVRAFVGSIRDITGQKKALEALRETNEYLNNLLNYTSAPIITWDREFRITRFNHAFENLTGKSQEEVLGKNLDILFPAGTKETSISLIKKTLDGERWESVEIPILTTDGSTRSILWNSANVLDRDGKTIAIIAQGVDITEQKKSIDRIRWLASFPEMNPNPVIEVNAKGEITFCNTATHTILQEQGLPDNPLLFLPVKMDELIRLLLETDQENVYREITLKNLTFAEYIALNRVLNVARVYTLDITEKRSAERERERLFAELEQKNAELERFAYTASHDLKTPLITIRGFLGFVERDSEAGDMVRLHEDLARIGNAAGKMQDLLDSLLELSKIGRIIGPPEKVSMRVLTKEAAELLAGPIHERDVTLTIGENLPEVYGDKKRLREVMVNLIENSVKFMGDQEKPVIEIGVRYDEKKPVFFVRDNGIGIPREYQGRLFSLFERIEVNVPGTGVGLALVKRIIEIHGGKIWVESEGAGKGTTFWFTLPGVPENQDNRLGEQE